jgi:hypothetical protein
MLFIFKITFGFLEELLKPIGVEVMESAFHLWKFWKRWRVLSIHSISTSPKASVRMKDSPHPLSS